MKVKMTQRLDTSWFENDDWRSYPPPGEVLETNDIHAADLLRTGAAVPVEEKPAPEEKRGGAKPAAQK